jgi:membrane-bound ClpP family serine protease
LVLVDTLPGGASEISVSSKIDLQSLVGEVLITHSSLRPMGTVKQDFNTFQAKTYDGFIDSGEKVKVLSIENKTLIVTKV